MTATVEQVLARHTPITLTDEHEGTLLTVCSHDGDDWPCDARVMAEQVAALGVGDGEVEWRVESDQTEDDFDGNEREAREWLARCKRNPGWLPARLMRREVTTTVGPWVEVTDEGGEG